MEKGWITFENVRSPMEKGWIEFSKTFQQLGEILYKMAMLDYLAT